MTPSGTSRISALSVRFCDCRSSSSAAFVSSGIPSLIGACDFLSNAYQSPLVVLLASISGGHFDACLTAL